MSDMEEKVQQYLRNVDRDRLEALDKKFPEEHLIANIKVLTNLIPCVGGSLATWIDEYYPNRQLERIVRFIEDLTQRTQRLERQIKAERAQNDEFGHLYVETLQAVWRDYQQEKIEAYRAILLNGLVMDNFLFDEGEFFLSLVRELSIYHIQMIRVLSNPNNSLPPDWQFLTTDPTEVSVQDTLYRVFTDAPDGFIDSIWVGLGSRGMVYEASYEQRTKYSHQSLPGTKIDVTENVLEKLPQALTPFGRRFVQFITEPPDDAEAEGQD
ncbi:hypothetical protein ACFLXQ_03650 [Chloroflexota bacterium]